MPTLCLNMIVKNESKIITRLLESVYKIIDCYCICDTGSTDNTIQIITDFFNEKQIKGKIIQESFKNFGYNRDYALKACVGMTDYVLLLDADMVLDVKQFKKEMLTLADCFCILQGTDDFFYYNKRIVKNNGLYNYIGVTHEYIDIPPNSTCANFIKDLIFIIDIGDGGNKTDKFERDINLLTKGIEDEPKNARYYFYLANSYYDIKNYSKAIETYEKRITFGGWEQEVWYSYFRIGLSYIRLNDIGKGICCLLDGYEYFPNRIENLYEIVHLYRIIGKQKLAMVYYNLAKDILNKNLNWSIYLFLQNDIYTYKLDYEYTIIASYTGIKNINKHVVTILNNSKDMVIINNLLSNMKFYQDVINPIKKIDMNNSFEYNINGENILFNSSSSCIIPNNNGNGYIMNMRYVNYTINSNGTYNNCEKHIITINKYIKLNDKFKIKNENIINIEYVDRKYIGIEDVRIFHHNSDILFIGTGFHSNDTLGIVTGKYNHSGLPLQFIEITPSFIKKDCEKNWVFVHVNNDLHIIYNWFPLQLCKLNENHIDLINTINMPNLFRFVRGSTNGFAYKNEIWFICHIVSYEAPRHYYHLFVIFDKNMKLLRYSAPHKFDKECIEYCLGLIVEDTCIICTYSTWDRTTNIGIYDKKYIDSLIIYKSINQ